MPVKKMGYEGLLYYGAAGSTAATQVTNSRDIEYAITPTTAPTTIRGSGSAAPIKTGRTVERTATLTWTMINKSDDSTLTALRAAANTGDPVALRYIPHSGSTGLDADCVISCTNGAPLNGEETFDFAVVDLNDDNRAPLLNS
jgi:hypothetical protein